MGKYDYLRPRFDNNKELKEFDWVPVPYVEPFRLSEPATRWDLARMHKLNNETRNERCLRMLRQLNTTCQACTMCELGRRDATKDYVIRDPHVFSNMNPSRFVVIGQNPGWTELELCEPFVGQSGDNFNKKIEEYGLSRDDFYITNAVKCFSKDNAKPSMRHVEACKPFLQMELQLLKPLLVITLGAAAFELLCPNHVFAECLQKITKDVAFGWPVFAAYHPSPRNMTTKSRKRAFDNQIRILCKLIKKLQEAQAHCTE